MLTFLGVIVGGVIGGGVTLVVQLLTSRSNREARRMERQQMLEDAHKAFQRDAILALHAAVAEHWERALDAYGVYHMTEPQQGDLRAVMPMKTAYSRLVVARAKVFNDRLRELTKELDEQAGNLSNPDDRAAADAALRDGTRLLTDIESRVNTLLQELV
jgi:gas vesicle protein